LKSAINFYVGILSAGMGLAILESIVGLQELGLKRLMSSKYSR
jgi:hypothetical protein